jgi:hypothetical protein
MGGVINWARFVEKKGSLLIRRRVMRLPGSQFHSGCLLPFTMRLELVGKLEFLSGVQIAL